MRWNRRYAPYLFIAPFFVLFFVFSLFPLAFSMYLSFHQWDAARGLEAMRWVGVDNYLSALTDPWFRKSLYNTVWLALAAGIPQHLVALPLAYLIHTQLRKSRNFVIGAYFLPYITSSVAIALIFSTLLSKDFGVVNAALGTNIDWLGSADYTKPAVAIVVFWRYVGWNALLYLTALQGIDKEIYEAARIDGASSWQQFRDISLPMLRPMIYLAVTLTLIFNLQLFEEPFILTGASGAAREAGLGGVGQSAMTTAMFMYHLAFSDGNFGTASALSWILFAIIASLTWVNSKLFGRGSGNLGPH
ncbi:carbohydrate ABC transporter permease [Usitatibacter palustris]|uniref:Lactose transport system permease protein LacF n=1 Tax=Usitatibacter palustris TaxID=2732487 RepID=A0A6M4H5Y1_9PROT|nr:sugar ABC transporter permease [Usitatibacter palustris]QJR14063.1 Lactose transport system permease protein LacF [Usitatibacter palustris]